MAVIAPTAKEQAHLQGLTVPDDVALVASYGSLVKAKRQGFQRIILAQHGAGQSYGGDPKSARNPGYPGGDRNDAVGLFLTPNEYSADRWRQRYPRAAVRIVKAPRCLPARQAGPGPVIAFSFHWDAYFSPEANGLIREFMGVLAEVANRWQVIGSGHPQRRDLRWRYEELGIEFVESIDEVCRRADLLCFDNTSAGFEFAATGRPVVVLNGPQYRRNVHHGGRFWTWSDIGPNATRETLVDVIGLALETKPRQDILELIYPPDAEDAAGVIAEWVRHSNHASPRQASPGHA